jgi:hypothetical protein
LGCSDVGHPTSQGQITINWAMNFSQSNTASQPYGPYFDVAAYDADITNPATGGPAEFGSFGIDATTDEVLYQQAGTGYLVTTGTGAADTYVTPGTWNQFSMKLNFGTQQYSVYLNGNLLATQTFVDNSLGLTTFTEADIAAQAAAGDGNSQAATGTAYFDNFAVVVPEPTTLTLGLAGLASCLCLARWRRRR